MFSVSMTQGLGNFIVYSASGVTHHEVIAPKAGEQQPLQDAYGRLTTNQTPR
jgi:hypothetical protein